MAGVAKVTFNGETWIDVTDKTVTSNKMLTTGTALDKKGDSITGSIASKTSTDVTFSGATVTVPAGAYSSAVTKTMNTAEVSVGADSSAVTNHAITITPKATVASNKDGYIASGTITGTAVRVSASQLVSGNMEIEANGTGFNVTNYATVSVAVPTSSRKATVVGSSPEPDSTFVQYNNQFYDTDGQEFDFAQSQSLIIYALGGSSGQIIINGTDMHTDEYTYTLPNSDIFIMFSATGTTHTVEISTESVPAMDLPTAPVTTAVGTKVGNNIEINTVTRYLNIPVGYNDTSQYYQIEPVPTMSLPTNTSPSDNGGTLKATVGRNALDRYINIPSGYNSSNAYYKISAVPDGQATVPNITGTSASVTTGTNTLTLSETISTTPTVNAGYIGSGTSRNASISLTASVPTQGSTTITPSSSSQTAVSAGTYCTADVTVGPIPGGYIVPSGDKAITSSGTTDVTSYATATVPAGKVYAPASISGSSSTLSTSATTITLSKNISLTPRVTTAGYVTAGTATTVPVSLSATLTTQATATFYPSTNAQTIASGTYLRGDQTFVPVVTQGIYAGNIKNGVVVKVGDDGENVLIKNVTGTFTKADTVTQGQTAATASQILSGYSAWVDGAEVKGSITTKTASDMTVNGATVTAPAGYYASNTSKSVETMTLPDAPTTNPSGTKKGNSIDRSTSTRYLNIPAGYNPTAVYYQITSDSNLTLPTTTSTNYSGTLKATIDKSTSVRYLNIPAGHNPSAAYYKISAVANGSATAPAGPVSATSSTVSTTASTLTLTNDVSITPVVSEGYITAGTAGNTTVSLTANITKRDSESLTTNGATVTAPAGYYPSAASKAVASGSVTAPASISATGATVNVADDGTITLSNSQVSVTPSLTNAGYISRATAGNSAVTLSGTVDIIEPQVITPSTSAQILVGQNAVKLAKGLLVVGAIPSEYIVPSGDLAISSSGTKDVTSYATATVPAGTVTAPASISGTLSTVTTSVSTITLSKNISVTPRVTTAGYVTAGTATTIPVSLSATLTTQAATTFYPSTNAQSIASGTYLRGAQSIVPVVTQGISAGNIKDGVVVKVGDDTNNALIKNVTGTFTDASTVSSGQTAATASQILSGYSAWVDGAEVQGSIATMTLPTAPTTTSSGTKIGSNIGRSTSTRYLNIPAGYNSTAQYYQISAVANMTLPTATSTSSSGTAKLTITPGASNKYLNIPTGYNGTASYYTISPGMTFETGTWTPTADIARGTISFASTHSAMPLYVCVFDQTQTTHATGSPSYMLYMDEYQIFGATFPSNTNFRYGCITSLFKTDSGTNTYTGTLQYPSTNTGNSSTAYPRYWVTESEFYPYSGSTARYWRSGRTYKWLAVWKAQ